MAMPFDDTKKAQFGMVLIITGVLLIGLSAVPLTVSAIEDPHDYQVSISPVSETADVSYTSLPETTQDALKTPYPHPPVDDGLQVINSVTRETSVEHPIDVAPATYDTVPEGISDGTVVSVESQSEHQELVASSVNSPNPATYQVNVTAVDDPMTLPLMLMLFAGLFVLAYGMKQKSDAHNNVLAMP